MATRTKAQRRAAAKAAWAKRKAEAEAAKLPAVAATSKEEPAAAPVAPPKVAYAVREGEDVFIVFAQDGSINRERLSQSLARKVCRELSAILI